MVDAHGTTELVTLDRLPPEAQLLFSAPQDNLFASLLWWHIVGAYAASAGEHAACAIVSTDNRISMALPVCCDAKGRMRSSLSSPYNFLCPPVFAPGADIVASGRTFGAFCYRYGSVRFDEWPADDPPSMAFIAGVDESGMSVLPFDHFGNWYEPVEGRSFDDYLAVRPGSLRSTVRRKLRAARQNTHFKLVTGDADLQDGIDDFAAIYQKSWKQAEPFPEFTENAMRALASAGLLRLGLLYADEKPIAVQFWAVSGGHAQLHKLAHDERAAALSPGTILTALMIESLLREGGIKELDFGRGDDPYKQLWTSHRRQRIGFILANRYRPAGILAIGQARLGSFKRALRGAIQTQTEAI
ncbi:MAG: hypothetical protein B7Z78_12350 [Rhodospirillales bacterium 20-60-12]|nr:MAG: hypothetical protein B7Z78_12350 [Rhodospirillales bacterium 20-60-12]